MISELSQDVFFTLPLTPTAKGDRIMHGNYLMDFDASSGALSLAIDFGLSDVVGWEFSGSGQYLYLFMGEFGTSIYQRNGLEGVDESDPMAGAAHGIQAGEPSGIVYFYPQRAPWSEVKHLHRKRFWRRHSARIVAPNLPSRRSSPVRAGICQSGSNWWSLINSFGNYFHRYVHGESLFLEGATTVCAGSPQPYSVYGSECLEGGVEWTVEGAGFTELANGEILIDFPASGTAVITATMALACGVFFIYDHRNGRCCSDPMGWIWERISGCATTGRPTSCWTLVLDFCPTPGTRRTRPHKSSRSPQPVGW